MAPTLYIMPGGPPTTAVLLLIRELKLTNIEQRPVDMFKGEHMTPEFLEMNPGHTVPFLKDGDFVLPESRAILQYLIDAYAPESNYLGRFAKKKARVQHLLHFDAGTLFPKVVGIYGPVLKGMTTVVSEDAKKALLGALQTLDVYLRKGYWAAGENVTIADFSLLASVSAAVALGVDISEYPNLADWYKKCHTLVGFEECEGYAQKLNEFFKSKATEDLVF